MTLFKTTPEQALNVARYALRMEAQQLPAEFIARVMDLARVDQGVYELLELWSETEDLNDRERLVADLQETVDEEDELTATVVEKPRIAFDNLEGIATKIVEHKRKLRDLIDRHGGVSAVARKSGIPQPSLSRLLNSASMPRRTTLYRLARAMGLDESAVITDWTR